jgi:hypothetical protein
MTGRNGVPLWKEASVNPQAAPGRFKMPRSARMVKADGELAGRQAPWARDPMAPGVNQAVPSPLFSGPGAGGVTSFRDGWPVPAAYQGPPWVLDAWKGPVSCIRGPSVSISRK